MSDRQAARTPTLEERLEASWKDVERDLQNLQEMDALDRLQAVQEWGDLERLRLGARIEGVEGVLGEADHALRPSEAQCLEAVERRAAAWIPTWRRHDLELGEAILEASIQEGTSPEVQEQVILSVAIFSAFREGRQPQRVEVSDPNREVKHVRAIDLVPSKFRRWARRRTFEHAEEMFLEKVGSEGLQVAKPGPATALASLAKEGMLLADPLCRIWDGRRLADALEDAPNAEAGTVERLRVHQVEGGLPRAEALKLIAGEREQSVREVFEVLARLVTRLQA